MNRRPQRSAPGTGWLMRGAALAQRTAVLAPYAPKPYAPSADYLEHWREVYQAYSAGVVAASIALTPDQAAAAARWDALDGAEWQRALQAMAPAERTVFLARYLVWKTGRNEGGDAKARTAQALLDDAQAKLSVAAQVRPAWYLVRDLAVRLEGTLAAYYQAEAKAKAAAPKDKIAAYTALARALQTVNAAKAALFAGTRGVFASDEELDAFAKWAIPATSLLIPTWLTPGPWRPTITGAAPGVFVRPPAPVAPATIIVPTSPTAAATEESPFLPERPPAPIPPAPAAVPVPPPRPAPASPAAMAPAPPPPQEACWYVIGKGYSWGLRPPDGEYTGLNKSDCENIMRVDREVRGIAPAPAAAPGAVLQPESGVRLPLPFGAGAFGSLSGASRPGVARRRA